MHAHWGSVPTSIAPSLFQEVLGNKIAVELRYVRTDAIYAGVLYWARVRRKKAKPKIMLVQYGDLNKLAKLEAEDRARGTRMRTLFFARTCIKVLPHLHSSYIDTWFLGPNHLKALHR